MIAHNGEYFPDVFLAGAPKSGTTFLFYPLSMHSGICASEPKEPDFYLDDTNPHRKSEKQRARHPYKKYFRSMDSHLLHLDGSQWTIYQTDLIKRIGEFHNKPKLLFILREPAARILSSFQYTSNNMSAVANMSFSQYVEYLLCDNDKAIRDHCRNEGAAYSLRNELRFSDYKYFLDLWKASVGSENMCIFLFEDMKTDTLACYQSVCNFLGLGEESMQLDKEQMNQSVEIKNRSVHYLLHKVYGLTGYKVPFKRKVKKLYGSLQHKRSLDSSKFEKDIELLKEHFRPLNEKLASAYQLDLRSWQ